MTISLRCFIRCRRFWLETQLNVEGISISHPARFILIGSEIPEEETLCPQLLDRFGMHAARMGTVKEC
jgi:Mg-chelatase subunit ChlI